MQKGLFWLCICLLFAYCNGPEEHSLMDLCPDTNSGKSYYAFNCEVTDLRKGKDGYKMPDQNITASFSNKPEVIGSLNCRKFVFDTEHPEMFVHFCCTDKHILVRHQAGERVALDTILNWDGASAQWKVRTSLPPKSPYRFIIIPAHYDSYLQDSVYTFQSTLGSINDIETWSRYVIGYLPKHGVFYFDYSLNARQSLRCKCDSPIMREYWSRFD